jgi:hypothetical protein
VSYLPTFGYWTRRGIVGMNLFGFGWIGRLIWLWFGFPWHCEDVVRMGVDPHVCGQGNSTMKHFETS